MRTTRDRIKAGIQWAYNGIAAYFFWALVLMFSLLLVSTIYRHKLKAQFQAQRYMKLKVIVGLIVKNL